MNYERIDVLTAFHAQHPDELEPTDEELEEFDTGLFKRYDKHINKHAPDSGIDLTPANRSRLVVFAVTSSGTPATQVRRACQFFASVNAGQIVIV